MADDYDAVIVAASVHGGKFQRNVCRWVQAYADRLNAKPSAFVPVCLGSCSAIRRFNTRFAALWTGFFREATGGHPRRSRSLERFPTLTTTGSSDG